MNIRTAFPPTLPDVVITPEQYMSGDYGITFADMSACEDEVRSRRKKGEVPICGLWQIYIENAGPDQSLSALVILEDQQVTE